MKNHEIVSSQKCLKTKTDNRIMAIKQYCTNWSTC